MTLLNLRHKGKSIGVVFLPTTVNAVNKAITELKRGYDPAGAVRITDADSPIQNLLQSIKCADPENEADVRKLNDLAARIDEMGQREQRIFSGALDAESINGLDDVLCIADSLDQYELIDNVASDRDFGVWLVENGRLGADVPAPLRPYLNYVAIGAEYLSAHGGAYTVNGYVKRREFSQEQAVNDRPALITIHLRPQKIDETMGRPYRLRLPATDEELDRAKAKLDIDYFPQANVVKIEFGIPSLEELIPQDCFCVEDANELVLCIEEMLKTDGEFLKYLAVLSVVQPETLTDALRLAMELDDYERITEDAYEYGQQALRRIGADDEVIDTIDGYEELKQAPPIPTGPPQKPDYVFRMNLRLIPAIPAPPDVKKLVEISLPATDEQILIALDMLGASGLNDTMGAILDGPLPGLRSEVFVGSEVLLANELAGQIQNMSGKDRGVLKAVMGTVGFDTLDDVIELAGRTDEYIFELGIRGVEQSAEAELNAMLGEKDAGLITQYLNLYGYGKALLEQENAAVTPYGRLQRRDGQPIQAMEQESGMGGMEGIK